MKRISIVSVVILLSVNLYAQEKFLANEKETQELSRKVVNLFSENKISECFDELSLYWPLPQNELEPLEEKTIKYLNR